MYFCSLHHRIISGIAQKGWEYKFYDLKEQRAQIKQKVQVQRTTTILFFLREGKYFCRLARIVFRMEEKGRKHKFWDFKAQTKHKLLAPRLNPILLIHKFAKFALAGARSSFCVPRALRVPKKFEEKP